MSTVIDTYTLLIEYFKNLTKLTLRRSLDELVLGGDGVEISKLRSQPKCANSEKQNNVAIFSWLIQYF
jgi:hypothetical protein